MNVIAEDGGAAFEIGKRFVKTVAAVKNVVAEDQRNPVLADERFGDQECLGDAFGLGLFAVIDRQAPGAAIAEQLTETRQIMRRGNETKLPDASFDQSRQRIIDHRLIIDGLKLFARHERERKQARTSASGQDNAFHQGGKIGNPGENATTRTIAAASCILTVRAGTILLPSR